MLSLCETMDEELKRGLNSPFCPSIRDLACSTRIRSTFREGLFSSAIWTACCTVRFRTPVAAVRCNPTESARTGACDWAAAFSTLDATDKKIRHTKVNVNCLKRNSLVRFLRKGTI